MARTGQEQPCYRNGASVLADHPEEVGWVVPAPFHVIDVVQNVLKKALRQLALIRINAHGNSPPFGQKMSRVERRRKTLRELSSKLCALNRFRRAAVIVRVKATRCHPVDARDSPWRDASKTLPSSNITHGQCHANIAVWQYRKASTR